MEQVSWNPWHGCHKCSAGCANCFVYQMDKRYGRDTNTVQQVKTGFNTPVKKDRQGNWKYPAGTTFKTCFTSDFFIEEADEWRDEAWYMIRRRSDCHFVIATKRIDRMKDRLPAGWGDGWDNVTISVSCENQEMADMRLPHFLATPIKHRYIFASPLLEYVDVTNYIKDGDIERVCVGGESYSGARPCNAKWVEQIYIDSLRNGVPFNFHQTGTKFEYNGKVVGGTLAVQQSRAEEFEKSLVEKYKNVDVNSIIDVI